MFNPFYLFCRVFIILALVINGRREIGNRLWRRFNLLIKLLRVSLLIIPVRALQTCTVVFHSQSHLCKRERCFLKKVNL